MIYLDTSVVLAHLLGEEHVPPVEMWSQTLISSRLLEYEMWTRVHARGLARSHGEIVRQLLGRIALVEMTPTTLERSLQPFPVTVRTLDALHLASVEFLRQRGQTVTLASYDLRMVAAAQRMGIPIYEA